MAIAGKRNERRHVTRIILRGPHPICSHADRREADPFGTWRAIVVEVETRMVRQNRQTAANQEGDEQEVEKVTIPKPDGKAVRTGRRGFVDDGHGRDGRQSADCRLHPRDEKRHQRHSDDPAEHGWTHPQTDAPIRWIVHGAVGNVEGDHARNPPGR
jgi:hypothetical protein